MSDQTPPKSYFINDEDPSIEDGYSAMPYSVDTSYHFDSVVHQHPNLSNTDPGLSDFGQTFSNDPGLIQDTL
jgi:hypothetical protein